MGNKLMVIRTLLLCLAGAFMVASCSDEPGPGGGGKKSVTEYKVAVAVPAADRTCWERTVGWALDNLAKAQSGLEREVRLDIEWIDENSADFENAVSRVADAPEYTALLGPISSTKARRAAELLKKSGKALILPLATSTEFQREYADEGFVRFLTQSDMTQSEILLTQARLSGSTDVCLLTSGDDYGRSFSDWFAYQATELGLKVTDIRIYDSGNDVRRAVREYASMGNSYQTTVVFAPSSVEDAAVFDSEFAALSLKARQRFPALLCSDIVNSAEAATRLHAREYEGISPSANPASGFVGAYQEKFGTEPLSGEAHLYDAVTMLAYALIAEGPENINGTLRELLDTDGSSFMSWLPDDMALTLAMLRSGNRPDLGGVTGNWDFDKKYGTTVLNTIFSHWVLRDGRYTNIEYLSTDGSDRTTSTLQAWDARTKTFQEFDSDQQSKVYGPLKANWAVVISTSDTWANYRHQADALAMYRLLRNHGYDDDHIILIMEDNIAYDPHNTHPGVVKVRPDGENLYTGVKVDYRLSDISRSDFGDILLGHASGRLHTVLRSGAEDNVIVFWTGHGTDGRLMWESNDEVRAQEIREIIEAMDQGSRFRKMMVVMDACYSGGIAEACTGIPGVLFLTAANAYEPSKADMKDPEMGIWLSNGFTRVFQETIDTNPSVSIRDLYYTVARGTTGSHATVYNHENYGNLFTDSMKEYLR